MRMLEGLHHWFIPTGKNDYKATLLRVEGMLLLVVALLFSQIGVQSAVNAKILGYASQIDPQEVIRLTNEERLKKGLGELKYNETLAQAAYKKGLDMLEQDYWSHVAPDGTEPWDFFLDEGYNYRYAGENLARDFTNPSDAVDAWMASPSHKDNLLSEKYSEIGIAVVEGDLNGEDTTLIVQLFGNRGEAIPVVPVASSETNSTGTIPTENVLVTTESETERANVSSVIPEVGAREIQESPLLPLSPFITTRNVSIAVLVVVMMLLVLDIFVIEFKGIHRKGGRTFAHLTYFGIILLILFIARAGEII